MAGPTAFVEAPARLPRKGGILSVAAEIRDNQERLFAGMDVDYIAEPCGFIQLAPAACWGNDGGAENKTYGGIDPGHGVVATFVGYAGVQCFLEGDLGADEVRRASAQLDLNEGKFLEDNVASWLTGAASDGTAANTVAAIALAEQTADALDGYNGLPVIWMSRSAAQIALQAGALVTEAGTGELFTANGTPVVATGVLSSAKLFVTGAITILRSGVKTTPAIDPTHNKQMAIAERAWSVLNDCDYLLTITVTAP